jgi:hypothetical protein
LTLVSKNALLKEFAKNPILHHFPIGENHWIHLAKTTRVLSRKIWASLKQSHPICTFLPSKAPSGPYGPLRVKKERHVINTTPEEFTNVQFSLIYNMRMNRHVTV